MSDNELSAAGTVPPLAVVTGASSGIGYELAKLLAKDGFDLVVAAEVGRLQTPAPTVARDRAPGLRRPL